MKPIIENLIPFQSRLKFYDKNVLENFYKRVITMDCEQII